MLSKLNQMQRGFRGFLHIAQRAGSTFNQYRHDELTKLAKNFDLAKYGVSIYNPKGTVWNPNHDFSTPLIQQQLQLEYAKESQLEALPLYERHPDSMYDYVGIGPEPWRATDVGPPAQPPTAVDYLFPNFEQDIDYSLGPPGKVFIETCYGILDYYKPYGDPPVIEVDDELYDHATGLARIELEAIERGEDIWNEYWLYGPWGTPERPKKVLSIGANRQIMVPDPWEEHNSHEHWLELGDPPTQLIPGGEFFVLQLVEAPYWCFWE